jgi:hypothetical protein
MEMTWWAMQIAIYLSTSFAPINREQLPNKELVLLITRKWSVDVYLKLKY